MALHIIRTTSELIASPSVRAAVSEGISSGGRAVVLVPSFAQGLSIQEAFASERGLSLGVSVSTPLTWASERWGLYGDGTAFVDATARSLVMGDVLAHAPEAVRGPLGMGAGTVRLLSRLAAEALDAMPIDASGMVELDTARELGLDPAEEHAVGILALYAARLREGGLCEPVCATGAIGRRMREAGHATPAIVLAGFSSMDAATFALVEGLAEVTDVSCVIAAGSPAACAPSGRLVRSLVWSVPSSCVTERGGERGDAPAAPSGELEALASSMFAGVGGIRPGGAVRQLLAGGPSAEAAIVRDAVLGLSSEGATRVAIAVPDVSRAVRELVPLLVSAGLAVKTSARVRVSETVEGRALLAFASSVATLAGLSANPPEEGRDDYASWWPPLGVVDFLLCSLSGVSPERAWFLDARWRGTRTLRPEQVLETLRKSSATSSACALATEQLQAHNVERAAQALAKGLAAAGRAGGREGRVLSAVESVARRAREVAGPLSWPPMGDAWERLLACVGEASFAERLSWEGTSGCTVEVMGYSTAALLEPGSVDALVVCGLTTAGWPLTERESAEDALLAKVGCAERPSRLERARETFGRLLRVPSTHLLLERALHDASANETYPAVMLSELAACYGGGLDALPVTGRSEHLISSNLTLAGARPRRVAEESPRMAGDLDPALRGLVVVPRVHRGEVVSDPMPFSATQIERYLECPYKWFALKRLGLRDVDAGFGFMQMGNLVHATLEATHARLIEQAAAGEGPGRVTPENLGQAISLLDEEYAAELGREMAKGRSDATIVPHDAFDRSMIERQLKDLEHLLERESVMFRGFHPTAVELSVGTSASERVVYAGCSLDGKVDRIDVDDHGRAIVIDYKDKSSLFDDYALLPANAEGAYALPKRVQTLIYAKVVRDLLGYDVVGAVYLGTRGNIQLSGAIRDGYADVLDERLTPSQRARMSPSVERCGIDTFDRLLDRTEELVGERIARLRAGEIPVAPDEGGKACVHCPVVECEGRGA